MLDFHFLGQNLHFAVSLCASLVMFAVAWLNFDAWSNRKQTHSLLISVGFLLLSVSFLVYSANVEQLGNLLVNQQLEMTSQIIRLVGLLLIIIAQIISPLQKAPVHEHDQDTPKSKEKKAPAIFGAIGVKQALVGFSVVLASLLAGLLYWRRSHKGMERHLKPVAIGFFSLSIYEILLLAHIFRSTDNIIVYNLVAPFGPVWIIEQIVLLATAVIFGRWVWRYLTKRFMSQLFMIFVAGIVAVFVAITLLFTALLLRNIQTNTLNSLKVTANVLGYAIESKRADTKATAKSIANESGYVNAVAKKDHNQLKQLSKDFLANEKQSTLIITDDDGRVLLRAEDADRWGDSISSDVLVRKALIGEVQSSVVSAQGVIAPTVYIKSTVPVRDASNTIIGTITSGVALDNSFVDGIKNTTGLGASIYSGNTRSATTTLSADGKSRWVGIKEETPKINSTVLKDGETYAGSLSILNTDYLAVYAPLRDINNEVIGMVVIGQPAIQILQAANNSIQKTFILTVGLLLISIIPAYVGSRYLERQI